MKRRFVLALVLPLTFATPSVAQSTADMSHPSAPYGPPQTVLEKSPPPSHPVSSSSFAPDGLAAVSSNGPRILAGTELGPDAVLGIGMFKAAKAARPFSIQREQQNGSRIAAVGVAVKF